MTAFNYKAVVLVLANMLVILITGSYNIVVSLMLLNVAAWFTQYVSLRTWMLTYT